MNEITFLQNQLEWERQAREQMEAMLEKKTIELFKLRKELQQLKENSLPSFQENRIHPELQTINDQDKAILSQISHELKTPLNVIVGSAHLLYDTLPSMEQVEHIDIIHSASQIIQRLVGDIQNYSKTENVEVVLEHRPVDLPKLIKSVFQNYSFKLDKSNINIAYYTDDRIKNQVLADQLAFTKVLKKMLDHIIDNIEAGKIFINTILLEEKGNKQKIEVNVLCQMTSNLNKIKDIIFPNHQIDLSAPRGSYHQIPLNLLQTSVILKQWNSRLNIEQVPEKGFNLSFHLLLDKTDTPRQTTKKSYLTKESSNLEKMEVLVVEDNQMNRQYLAGLMKKWKVKADMAVNGKEALSFTQSKTYDLILMDVLMPKLNGLETTVCIRNANNPNKETPIVAITATDSETQRKKAMETGMNDFLEKPFNPDSLLEILNKYYSNVNRFAPLDYHEMILEFNKKLDANHLEQLYGTDIHFAIENFNTFIKETVGKDFPLLKELMQGGHWGAFTQLIQKLKTACTNVGINELLSPLEQLEALAQAQPDFLLISNLLRELDQSLNSYQPIIKVELKKMQSQLAKIQS